MSRFIDAEPRYVDADSLKQKWLFRGKDGKPYRDEVDAMPTADVVEVVHGEWIAEEIHNCWTEFECSVCKFKHKSVHNFGKPMTEFNYCPNCGADMRGGRNELYKRL